MKIAILAICAVAAATAKPHVFLYDGAAPIGSDGRVIDTPEVALAKATHLAALSSASAKASSAASSQSGYSYAIPAATYGVAKQLAPGWFPAPLAADGRVVDTAEVAQLKAERLAVLEKANAEAAAAEASAAAQAEVHTVYGVPITMAQIQGVPTFIMADPIPAPIHQGYSGPAAPLGQDGRVIDTEEVAKLKAEHLATLAKAHAAAAALAAAMGSSTSADYTEGYTYSAPAVQVTETFAKQAAVAAPQQGYNGPYAPLSQDGQVIDTDEVAKLKAEHLAAVAQANAIAAAYAAASAKSESSSASSSSSEGYTYNAPAVQHTETVNSQESGYTYNAPAVQFNDEAPVAQAQQVYNGPPAPIGQDGRVIDTEEVAKLKAEHLAALGEAYAAAAAYAAASAHAMSSYDSSAEGYTYTAPAVQFNDEAPVAQPHQVYGAPAVQSNEQAPVAQPHQVYNGPPAPLGQDGRVIDTEEVAKLKAEHLAALEQANAAAAAFAKASGSSMTTFSSEGYTYNAPAVKHTETSNNQASGYTYTAPAIQFEEAPVAQPQHVYNGPPAPLGQDGRVIDTEEVAKLKAEHLATLEKANAAAAAFAAATGSSMTTYSSEGYTYNVPAVKNTETSNNQASGYTYDTPAVQFNEEAPVAQPHQIYGAPAVQFEEPAPVAQPHQVYGAPAVQAPVAQPQQVYNGPPAPLGQDGRVIDTEEVATLKAEHLAALEKANAAAAAFAKASGSSMTTFASEGYTYMAPAVKHTETSNSQASGYTYTAPAVHFDEAPAAQPQQVYNGPAAPLGQDGRVIDTEEVAKLKAEHLAALEKANSAAAAFAAATGSSMTTFESEGYTYVAPAVQHTEIYEAPAAKPHQIYNGPAAPLGEDGRVIDTDEVSKLKAEHIATLAQANAAAAASEAASSTSSSSEGYSYDAPIVPQTTYGSPASTYGSPAVQQTETIVESIAQPQQHYNGPPAPLGEDGRVIDTEEVSKLKAEHIATLTQATAAAVASAAAEAASSSSSSSESYSYETPIVPQTTYGAPAAVQTFADVPAPAQPQQTYGAPAAVQTFADAPAPARPQQTYGGPLAPLSADGQVIDTDEVAQLKAEHLATLAQANAHAESSAAAESTSYSSAEVTYGAPIVQQVQPYVAAAPTAKPSTFYGPPAPLSADGQVVDTDEVARLKAEHLATLAAATSKAIADASAETAEKPETTVYTPSLPSTRPLPSFTAPAAENKPAAPATTSHAAVTRVIRRRPAYSGPPAPLGPNGRVIDTEEVAQLKAERLSTLSHATSFAIKLAQTKKTSSTSAENSFEGYQ